MERVKPNRLIIGVGEQVFVASVVSFHVVAFALLTIPESVSTATSLGGLVWDQLSTPSPSVPAGDLTLELVKIWANHFFEVEFPRFFHGATLSMPDRELGRWSWAVPRRIQSQTTITFINVVSPNASIKYDSARSEALLGQNFKPDVLMMEATEDWHRCDAPNVLDLPKIRGIFVQ